MRTSRYYQQGYEEGKDAAHQTDWEQDEMKEKYERDELGEVVGRILENWQQTADTIYYDETVTSKQLDAFEAGFYDGFCSEVEKILKRGKQDEKMPRM
jgi:hypothetical protein